MRTDLDATIAVICDVLGREYEPEVIFLFGSHAWGDPDEQSDLDICVIVKDSMQSQAELIRKGLRALLNYHINLDLLVFTANAFHSNSVHPSTLAYQIANKGIKLYEAA